jgi:hypothetical protein
MLLRTLVSSHLYPYINRFMYSSVSSHESIAGEKKMKNDDVVTFFVGPFSGVKP